MVSDEQFAGYIRDALVHYYDSIRMRAHPLINLLRLQAEPNEIRGQLLRKAITNALNLLRPLDSVPYGDPEWLPYRTLWLRYIEGQEIAEICTELAFSRTSYYRYYRTGLAALVNVLWRSYQEQPLESELAADEAADDEKWMALESKSMVDTEVAQVVAISAPGEVDTAQVLESALQTIAPLAKQEGMELTPCLPHPLPKTYGDRAALHQIIVNVLAEGIRAAAANKLRLIVTPRIWETVWRLEYLDASRVPEGDLGYIAGFRVSRTLLAAYGGRLWLDNCGAGVLALCFTTVSHERQVILVIDNDPDAAALYRGYLQFDGYLLEGATTSDGAKIAIAQNKPDLVLLDLLMPHEDGWSILRWLKSNPEIADIPVIVCSVLSQPQLALSLGAAQVLQKPISQKTLIRAVRAALTRDDNSP